MLLETISFVFCKILCNLEIKSDQRITFVLQTLNPDHQFIVSIKVRDICGGSDHRVYYDASIERLSEHHLPYVVLITAC